MKLQTPPELADGGYWYAVPIAPDIELGGQTPGPIPGVGWCAWYHNGLVAARCPEAVSGLEQVSTETVDGILSGTGYAGKPRGRVRGR